MQNWSKMIKSHISIESEKGILYEGEGAIFDSKLRINWIDRINYNLSAPWYNLLEIKQEDNDIVKFTQCTIFKENLYAITEDTTISEHTCTQRFLERLIKNK